MASIEKRKTQDGKLTYRVKVRLKGSPVQSATFERLTDARKWAQQTESAIREGRYFKTAESMKHTLNEAIDRYIHYVLPTKPKSYYDQKAQLSWWSDQIGQYTLAHITPSLISEYRDKLVRGYTVRKTTRSPATTNRYLAALSHLFTIALKEWEWVNENPVLKVAKISEPRGRVRCLNNEERRSLLGAAKDSNNDYLYLIVVLALSTGARKMEILNMRWSEVDFARGVIVLNETKNGERRVLPMQGHALELMEKHSRIRRLDSDLVFPSSSNSKQPVDIRKSWETALKKAEIEDFRFHDLRHSAASYLLESGASLAELAEVLGHKTLQMVKRYAHLSDAHAAKIVAKMNERIFG